MLPPTITSNKVPSSKARNNTGPSTSSKASTPILKIYPSIFGTKPNARIKSIRKNLSKVFLSSMISSLKLISSFKSTSLATLKYTNGKITKNNLSAMKKWILCISALPSEPCTRPICLGVDPTYFSTIAKILSNNLEISSPSPSALYWEEISTLEDSSRAVPKLRAAMPAVWFWTT